MNYRSIQNTNGRLVYYYESSCNKIKKPKKKKFGHYEKIYQKLSKNYFVPNYLPSKVPGALMVPAEEVE